MTTYIKLFIVGFALASSVQAKESTHSTFELAQRDALLDAAAPMLYRLCAERFITYAYNENKKSKAFALTINAERNRSTCRAAIDSDPQIAEQRALKNCERSRGRIVDGHLLPPCQLLAKDVELLLHPDDFGIKPAKVTLHRAAHTYSLRMIESRLEAGGNVNEIDDDGNTPLMHAIQTWRSDVVRYLVSEGADMSIANHDGLTAIHLAARSGATGVLFDLIELGADANSKTIDTESTPVHLLAQSDSEYAVKELILRGVSVDIKNADGETALHFAARAGSRGTVEALIEIGANVNVQNKHGKTPVELAINNRHRRVIEILKSSGAK